MPSIFSNDGAPSKDSIFELSPISKLPRTRWRALNPVKFLQGKLSRIKSVMSVPEQEPLSYEEKDGRVEFVLPQLVGHQMIALELC